MDLRKTDYDPSTSNLRWRPVSQRGDLRTEVAFDPDGRVHQRHFNDSGAHDRAMDFRHEMAAEGRGFVPDGSMKRIATLTPSEVMWLREVKGVDVFNPNHAEGLRRILNDPEYRRLRTSTGSF